jgi:hypothetical protein
MCWWPVSRNMITVTTERDYGLPWNYLGCRRPGHGPWEGTLRRTAALFLLILASTCAAFTGTRHMPLPPALVQAKRIYIDNQTPDCPECADHAYDELSKWGRFQTVADPKEADLIFVLKSTSSERPVSVVSNTMSTGTDSSHTSNTVVSQ